MNEDHNIEPSLWSPDKREVSDPFAVRLIGRELPVDYIRRDGGRINDGNVSSACIHSLYPHPSHA